MWAYYDVRNQFIRVKLQNYKLLQYEQSPGMLQRGSRENVRKEEEGENLLLRGKTATKLCMLAWLGVFLCGPFGGLLLIKLLLHDAPS